MAQPQIVKPKKFDEARLAAMAPPFNVRIEKIKGTQRTPIPMPDAEDGNQPGTNWGIEEVRQLEQWLVTEWAGGGLYEITLTDSAQQTLQWTPFWDIKQFPEKTPPPLEQAASPNAPPMAQAHQPQLQQLPLQPQQIPQPYMQGRAMPPFPTGLPNGLPYYQQNQQAAPGYYPLPQMPHAPPIGGQQWDAYRLEVERRERENRDREQQAELKRLHDLKDKTEREAQAAQHAAALERERQANAAAISAQATQLAEMRNMISGLANAIKETATRPTGPSPELEAMRLQLAASETREREARTERENERRDRETKDMIARMEQNNREQIAEMRRAMDAQAAQQAALAAAAAANKGPDQLMLMWQNSQREQLELTKEMSRNETSRMTALQTYMMNPRDMMAMAKENSVATEQAIERSTNFFGKVIETQQKVTENLLQMQPGSNGVVEIVGSSLDRVGTLAERYLGGKQLETQLAHQSQVQIAEAQARAYAQTVNAQTAAQHAAQATQMPPVPNQAQSAGLGNPQPQPPKKKKKKATIDAQAIEVVDPHAGDKRLGKTDEEWFAGILPQVKELRANANKFIVSIADNDFDKSGNPKGWNPEYAAGVVIQAVGIVVSKQVEVPALMFLLFQDRFADFTDVLLPDPIVTQQYRDEVTQAVIRHARTASGLPPEGETIDQSGGDDEEDEDEDDAEDDTGTDETGDDDDDEVNGAEPLIESNVVAMKRTSSKSVPVRRA